MYRNAIFEFNYIDKRVIMGHSKSLNGNEPLTIVFDTSGRTGSTAIGLGDKILAKRPFSGKLKHSSELFNSIFELLKSTKYSPENIARVFFTIGPGSFTGLRIGVTVAKMMHLANKKIKIIGLNTLDCLALNAVETNISRCGTILDAKRGLFFASIYEIKDSKIHKLTDDALLTADEFCEITNDKEITVLGEGLVYYKKDFSKGNIKIADENLWTINIDNVYHLGLKQAKSGNFDDPVMITPEYLRKPDAKIKPQMG